MIKRYIFYIVLIVVAGLLFLASFLYKGGNDAMVAQVENQVTAISFQKPVMVRNIYVSPGQVVDSGDLLIEVERPDMALDLDKKLNEKYQLENRLEEATEHHHNSLRILQTEYDRKQELLFSEKEELEYELKISDERGKKMDGVSTLGFVTDDTLKLNRIKLIENQLNSIELEFDIEKLRLFNTFRNDTFRLHSDLNIIEKEIEEFAKEQGELIRKAEKKGTIGNLFVQLNELVPPYKTLLSVYDLNPTLIKAFISESGVQGLQIGSKVIVESINRDYSIRGQIVEIGSRVTAYPDKINPLMDQKSYGQEIFINIPDKNNFLNGEKVFVYVIDDEG